MSGIRRIYVEKRPGFDMEARRWLSDLQSYLNLPALQDVRILNRYDVQGMHDGAFERACATIFAEPNADILYRDCFPYPDDAVVFAIEYLPGQYDMRADSAIQCAQMLGDSALVRTARVMVLSGDISREQIAAVKRYCINPVESREASMDMPDSLEMQSPPIGNIPRIEGFTGLDEMGVRALHKSLGLAMSQADLLFTQAYFRDEEGRDPTETEIRVLDTYWSDHCRHTTFSTILCDIELPDGPYRGAFEGAMEVYRQARKQAKREDKPMTLMDLGTIGARALSAQGKLARVDRSDEVNACSVFMPVTVDGREETWLLQFKNETHNHPTEIEPFGGAATCLGGAIRDILAGRAYAHQAMRVTGCADPNTPFDRTVPGRLPQRQITTGAAAGFSSYGNQIGLATGQVYECYDPGYVAKRMEVGAVIGAVKADSVVRQTPTPGDVVVLLGGRTGRDGIGGATGSSVSHTTASILECGSQVQKGNAPTERKIQRLILNPDAIGLIKRCNDFGAGGVSVAIGELADSLLVNLDSVPKKYEGLNGTELAISESQERMAMVLSPENVEAFMRHAYEENLECTVVATVTETGRLQMDWRGDRIVDISRAFLDTAGVSQRARASIKAPAVRDIRNEVPETLKGLPVREAFLGNMATLNTASQKGLVERFDSTIGARTVLMPFAGKTQTTPEEAMVAKLPVEGETDDATAMAFGFCPEIANWSPLHAGAYAVVQSLMKLCAVGADLDNAHLSFQEYFENLKDNPQSWGKPAASLLGALCAQLGLGVAAIGGKDSMSGTFMQYNVPPTLISFAIAPVKASAAVSAALSPGMKLYRVALPVDENGLPLFLKVGAVLKTMAKLHAAGSINAAAVVREGGMAAALCRMCLGNRTGFAFAAPQSEQSLFALRLGDLLISPADGTDLDGLDAEYLGCADNTGVIALGNACVPVDELADEHAKTLEGVFRTRDGFTPAMQTVPLYGLRPQKRSLPVIARPRVVIPVFPGTNCELDSARAFALAGAHCETVVVNNLSDAAVMDTVDRLGRAIDNAQILMLPGGFSAGDEPDGSGKFIAVTLRNERVAKAIERLLEARDGLILGICNGFQALIKLGLLPYGRIADIEEDDPTLTYNAIGRHVSTLVRTKVVSVKTPWMALCEAGDVHTIAVSHGEGRFVCSKDKLAALIENGQVVTQYVDGSGIPSASLPHNPNGSDAAVEGICSPCGRIYGKMAHSERIGENIAKNVPGDKDQKLFASGVRYFH
jgi:phosphoribosylformylglycinamidine synthase